MQQPECDTNVTRPRLDEEGPPLAAGVIFE